MLIFFFVGEIIKGIDTGGIQVEAAKNVMELEKLNLIAGGVKDGQTKTNALIEKQNVLIERIAIAVEKLGNILLALFYFTSIKFIT